jgi:hypothetical protein
MKKLSLLLLLLSFTAVGFAQKYMTQSGKIRFYSKAKLENIEAVNNQVSSVFNMENGEMAFTLLMKAFLFEKALMQEHFNEKYVESDKFPKAQFKGAVVDFEKLKLDKTPQKVTVKGQLTLHGVTKEVVAEGTLQKNGNNIVAKAVFTILLEDYQIKIPAAVADNISKTIEIHVDMDYAKM